MPGKSQLSQPLHWLCLRRLPLCHAVSRLGSASALATAQRWRPWLIGHDS